MAITRVSIKPGTVVCNTCYFIYDIQSLLTFFSGGGTCYIFSKLSFSGKILKPQYKILKCEIWKGNKYFTCWLLRYISLAANAGKAKRRSRRISTWSCKDSFSCCSSWFLFSSWKQTICDCTKSIGEVGILSQLVVLKGHLNLNRY